MNTVLFPGLNLELNISRVAFKVFNVEIYWYALIIVISIILALIIFKIKDGKYGISFNNVVDLVIYILPISFLSARIYYVIFNLDFYLANPSEIISFRSGGLAIYGGIIGGALTCLLYCNYKKINILDLFDYLVPSLALAQSIGRWGNFFNIEAYRN